MNNNPASSMLGSLRRLLVVLAVFAGSAHAAVYTGVWDPPFGAPFTGLGWRGTAEFFVPDSCVPSGDAIVINPFPLAWGGCGGAAAITSAEVQFYDASPEAPADAIGTLDFSTNAPYLQVVALLYDDGTLDQILSTPSNLISAGFTGFGVTSSTYFFLTFTLDGPVLGYVDCGTRTSYETSLAATNHTGNYGCRLGFSDNEQFPPQFTITRVPEPGTLALTCLGLLGLAPRRMRAFLTARR